MKKLQLQKTQLKQKVKVRKLNFVLGEKLKRDEALKLMLIISADPIAESIAEHIAGSKK